MRAFILVALLPCILAPALAAPPSPSKQSPLDIAANLVKVLTKKITPKLEHFELISDSRGSKMDPNECAFRYPAGGLVSVPSLASYCSDRIPGETFCLCVAYGLGKVTREDFQKECFTCKMGLAPTAESYSDIQELQAWFGTLFSPFHEDTYKLLFGDYRIMVSPPNAGHFISAAKSLALDAKESVGNLQSLTELAATVLKAPLEQLLKRSMNIIVPYVQEVFSGLKMALKVVDENYCKQINADFDTLVASDVNVYRCMMTGSTAPPPEPAPSRTPLARAPFAPPPNGAPASDAVGACGRFKKLSSDRAILPLCIIKRMVS